MGCHRKPLFSTHEFKALALPAFGPGRTRPFDPMPRDTGRMGESDNLDDAYRFRIPMLRNVTLTEPYGHNGAYPSLNSMIKHHLNPEKSRAEWSASQVQLPAADWLSATDFIIRDDKFEMQRQAGKVDINLPSLSNEEVDDLVSFLHALTGDRARAQDFYIPATVPSGLAVDR